MLTSRTVPIAGPWPPPTTPIAWRFRSLRDLPIEPPRDLWARTSAGIEREASRHGRPVARRATSDRGGRSRLPVGAMAGVAVVAVVVGATALSGGWLDQPVIPAATSSVAAAASPDVALSTFGPAATPILVAAGSVGWVHSLDDGAYAYNVSPVDHVCPVEDQPGCAALDDDAAKRIVLTSTPRTIIGSPTDDQAVVVGSDGSGADQVTIMSLAGRRASPEPTPSETATPTETAKPTATPAPTDTATPSETASVEPSDTPSATASADPSADPGATEVPSSKPDATPETPAPTPTPEPTAAPTPRPTPESTPVVTASPQATATAIAIATGVTVVGQSAAFSADGSWFAFTARPADGSAGPDIYVWHMGDETARRLTHDGGTVFASWSGDKVVASRLIRTTSMDDGVPRASDAPSTLVITPTSLILDPRTGKVTGDPMDLWRPVVDPTNRFAVAWSGSVLTDAAGTAQAPGTGQLILTSWLADADTSATRSKVPGGKDPMADFDIRWNEDGQWLAIWTADPSDPSIGRLSLFKLDRGSGTLVRPDGAPTDVPALPGFSIGDGRLAWVTPHGQDAEGSKVQVVAWSGNDVGAVESVPGEDVVVVR